MWTWSINANGTKASVLAQLAAAQYPDPQPTTDELGNILRDRDDAPIMKPDDQTDRDMYTKALAEAVDRVKAYTGEPIVRVSVSGNSAGYKATVRAGPEAAAGGVADYVSALTKDVDALSRDPATLQAMKDLATAADAVAVERSTKEGK